MNSKLLYGCTCLLLCIFASSPEALMVTVSQKEAEQALREGREQGDLVAEYVNLKYRFGEEGIFRENGIVRTKWSKLMVIAGLLASRSRRPSDEEIKAIIENTELQIDLHALGARMDFANSYTTYIVQSGRRIDPEKIAVNDVAYLPHEGFATSAFPQYRATIRSYFSYDKLNPFGKAEIVLVKDKKKVSFALDFAGYK